MSVPRPPMRTNIGRRLEILDCLMRNEAGGNGGLGVVEASELMGREKSQVSRGLRALAADALVVRDMASRAYLVGPRVLDLAGQAGDPELLRRARPVCQRLARELGERAQLCTLVGSRALIVETVGAMAVVQAVAWVGMELALHCTTAGRALLFDFDDLGLRELFEDGELADGGASAPHSLAELSARLEAEREAGFASGVGDFEDDLAAVAAPVRGPTGKIVAAVGVSGPRSRLAPVLGQAGQAVLEGARSVYA